MRLPNPVGTVNYKLVGHVEKWSLNPALPSGIFLNVYHKTAATIWFTVIDLLLFSYSPTLTWRDVQYISVLSASAQSLNAVDWIVNGAGHKVSHHFGFGMMDAGRMVDYAANWTTLPEQHICEVSSPQKNRYDLLITLYLIATYYSVSFWHNSEDFTST